MFPIDINKASYESILRVPGIGVLSAKNIILGRRYSKLNLNNLKKIGVVLKRAKFFIRCNELKSPTIHELLPENVRSIILNGNKPLSPVLLSI